MGSMGFGNKSWVNKMKPRRPFSKDRKPLPYETGERDSIRFDPKFLSLHSKKRKKSRIAEAARVNLKISQINARAEVFFFVVVGLIALVFIAFAVVYAIRTYW